MSNSRTIRASLSRIAYIYVLHRAAVRDVSDEEIDRLLAEVAHYRASSLQKVNVQQQESMQYQQTYEDYLRDERESTEASLQGLDSDYPQGFD